MKKHALKTALRSVQVVPTMVVEPPASSAGCARVTGRELGKAVHLARGHQGREQVARHVQQDRERGRAAAPPYPSEQGSYAENLQCFEPVVLRVQGGEGQRAEQNGSA